VRNIWMMFCFASLFSMSELMADALPRIEEKSCNGSSIVPVSVAAAAKPLSCMFTIRADGRLKPSVYLEVIYPSGRNKVELIKAQANGEIVMPISFSVDPLARQVRLVFRDVRRTRTLHTFQIRTGR